jgi:hypothetical protein
VIAGGPNAVVGPVLVFAPMPGTSEVAQIRSMAELLATPAATAATFATPAATALLTPSPASGPTTPSSMPIYTPMTVITQTGTPTFVTIPTTAPPPANNVVPPSRVSGS